jgi:hypothetical protein
MNDLHEEAKAGLCDSAHGRHLVGVDRAMGPHRPGLRAI